MTSEEEPQKDSREYLKEVVRSNGRLGEFWSRGRSMCVQVKTQAFGNVRFLIDPDAFGGKGCINDAITPKHIGDPYGWKRIGFLEFARVMKPTISDKISSLGHRSAWETRTFVGSPEAPKKFAMDRSHLAVAGLAPLAAADMIQRMRRLTASMIVDGQPTLSASLYKRGFAADPNFESDLLSLYDMLGEMAIFQNLFGPLLTDRDKGELDQVISSVKAEIQKLNDSLDQYSFDMTLLKWMSSLLDFYLVTLSLLTSKCSFLPALTESAVNSFAQEVYYGLQETRTVAENIMAAALYTGHPPDLLRWIAEFRLHDYALREILDKVYAASPSVYETTTDIALFRRDRFGYPPEIAWWMWHAVEREMGMPISQAFAFDPREVSQKIGLRVGSSEEVVTTAKPKALIGKHVEIIVIQSKVEPFIGLNMHNLRVTEITKSELDENGYFMAEPEEPLVLTLDEEHSFTVARVRFGSSLPRSPPQIVVDKGFRALMMANPYKRVIVDVAAELAPSTPPPKTVEPQHLGFGLLGLVEPGQPSIFEFQRYRLVQEFAEKLDAQAKAWDIDYRG